MRDYTKLDPAETNSAQERAAYDGTDWSEEFYLTAVDRLNYSPLPINALGNAAYLTATQRYRVVIVTSDASAADADCSPIADADHLLITTPPNPIAMLPFWTRNRAGRRTVAYGPTSLYLEHEQRRRENRTVIAGPLIGGVTDLAPHPSVWSAIVLQMLVAPAQAVFIESRQQTVQNRMWRLHYPSGSVRVLADVDDVDEWVEVARQCAPKAELTVVSWKSGKTIREVRS